MCKGQSLTQGTAKPREGMDVCGWAAWGVAFGIAHGSELPAEMCCLRKSRSRRGCGHFAHVNVTSTSVQSSK